MKRQRILFISRETPSRTGIGAERRAAQNLFALSKIGDVTLILRRSQRDSSIIDPDVAEMAVGGIIFRNEMAYAEVRYSKRLASTNLVQRAFHHLMQPPYHLDISSPADAKRYREELGDDYDVVFCFRLSSAVWYDSVFGTARGTAAVPQKIVDLDDIESRSFKEGNLEPKPDHFTGRVRFWHHGRIIARLERHVARSWDTVLLCSDLDVDRFEEIAGRRVIAVPNTTLFGAPQPEPPEQGRINILFVGSFPYQPNQRGALWLVREVWPLLQSHDAGRFSLTLAGYNPSSEITAFDGCDNIEVLDSPPDLDQIYAKANIIAVPIFSGSGTRIKVIEAMAKMRAVVSTTVGCEGLGLVNGQHYVDANDAPAFANAIASLADDRDRRLMLAKTAYDHAFSRFSQRHVDARIAELVNDAK